MDIGDFFQKKDADALSSELFESVFDCDKVLVCKCSRIEYEIVMSVIRRRIDSILPIAEKFGRASVFTRWWWRLRLCYENYRLNRSVDFCRMYLGLEVK